MRILHTADWHLGHTLRDHARTAEHAHFLDWLVRTAAERHVDVLLIAGDVFDSANPPPAALRLWFGFLGALKRACPRLQVVAIAGNHDSAARLLAPRDLLEAFDVRIVGTVVRGADGRLVTDDLLVPLRAADGSTAAWCVAIPFLRSGDITALAAPGAEGGAAADAIDATAAGPARDPLVDGMRALHEELFAAAAARRAPDQAVVAMAHGYLVGGALSELSERKVLGGNQHALPLDLFPRECAYVALGHLHRPQPLAGLDHVRYSGSPIPLSMPEREHPHHVVFADLDGARLDKVWSLRVPRLVAMLRLPERGELAPDAAIAAAEALPPRDPAKPEELRPFVEVAVRLAEPAPSIAERIARVLADKDVRLVRVEVLLGGRGDGGAADARPADLASYEPEQVFTQRYHRDHDGPVPEWLLAAFRRLLDEVEHEGSA